MTDQSSEEQRQVVGYADERRARAAPSILPRPTPMTENTKTLTVTLEIEIGEMSDEQLRDAGWFSLMEPDDDDDQEEPQTPPVDEFGAHEIAHLLPGAIAHPDAELFAGSGVFVNLGEVRVVSAAWKA